MNYNTVDIGCCFKDDNNNNIATKDVKQNSNCFLQHTYYSFVCLLFSLYANSDLEILHIRPLSLNLDLRKIVTCSL